KDETQLPFHAPHLRNQMLAELSPNPNNIARFAAFVDVIASVPQKDEIKKEPTPVGPPIKSDKLQSGRDIKALLDTGLELKENSDGTFQLKKNKNQEAFKVNISKIPRKVALTALRANDPCTAENINSLKPNDEQKKKQDVANPVSLKVEAELRSAQSMIFYLGELTEVDLGTAKLEDPDSPNLGSNKFWEITTDPTVPAAISVWYRGQYIAIPEGEENSRETLQMMTLVQQIYELNSASDDAPEPSPVLRLIN
ncbi:MAG: hypothetical protein AAFV19_11570, partial [Pseudomonadota bacterium]